MRLPKTLRLNLREVTRDTPIRLKLSGAKTFRLRTRVAVQLIRFACWLAGFKGEISVGD
jgi:hypothetical protein